MSKLMTLGLLLKNDKILLGMKKRGFGAGRWNGFGGKVGTTDHPNETIEQAFVREYREECNIDVIKYERWGVIEFEFKDDPEILEVCFFKVLLYNGRESETDEMRPQWFRKDRIPYESMWPDDKYWMPLFLDGKKFRGKIYFENKDKILRCDLRVVDSV